MPLRNFSERCGVQERFLYGCKAIKRWRETGGQLAQCSGRANGTDAGMRQS